VTTASVQDEVLAFLIKRLAHTTKLDEAAINGNTVFVDMGLQSIDAVLLCGEVEDHFAIELDPATIFEHETVGSFAEVVRQTRARI
jgi:acyl carrier protein